MAKKGPAAELKEQNQLSMVSDNECSILALIIKGLKGEQHKVILFDEKKGDPLSAVNRAGNTDLEFNMNSHIRAKNQIFIVQTESNDSATAKQLEFTNDTSIKEPIPFTRPQRGFAKDCWVIQSKEQREEDEFSVFTIVKSSTDECINSSCTKQKMYTVND